MANCGILQVFVLFLFFVAIHTDDLCDPVNGAPSNGEYCMLIPNYDTYQRAECGQPPFITSSNKTETCINGCRDYCWLPCMVKEFDQHSGNVSDVCLCMGDPNQMCENVTGSVEYYTECANRTVPCPSPSYVDFAVVFFTWLGDSFNSLYRDIAVDNSTISTPCLDNANKTTLRLCVETSLRPMVAAQSTCADLNGNFDSFFNQCLQESCVADYDQGVAAYLGSVNNNTIWNGALNIAENLCTFWCTIKFNRTESELKIRTLRAVTVSLISVWLFLSTLSLCSNLLKIENKKYTLAYKRRCSIMTLKNVIVSVMISGRTWIVHVM